MGESKLLILLGLDDFVHTLSSDGHAHGYYSLAGLSPTSQHDLLAGGDILSAGQARSDEKVEQDDGEEGNEESSIDEEGVEGTAEVEGYLEDVH